MYVKILPIKPQKNCCVSPYKTQEVLYLKQHCTDRSVWNIKVLQEPFDRRISHRCVHTLSELCDCYDSAFVGVGRGVIFFSKKIFLYSKDITS